MTSLCEFQNVTKPTVKTNTQLNDWLLSIKSNPFADSIIQARNGQVDYDKTKTSLPCVTYNFNYDGYKKDANAISSTGVIYIDIDNPTFDIKDLDRNKVYSYYRSFGGNGWAIIAKAQGITLENFKATYSCIVDELGLSAYVDSQAVKASQFSILSYDENIFINEKAYEFSASTYSNNSTTKNVLPTCVIERERRHIHKWEVQNESLRFTNLDDFDLQGKDYVVDWDGQYYVNCFIPMKKRTNGQRNSFLLSYANNFVILNPTISREAIAKVINSVNEKACVEPIKMDRVYKIVDSILGYKEAGTLRPIVFWKKRKFFFDATKRFTRKEKWGIITKELGAKREDATLQKINNIILDWDFEKYGKITQRNITKHNPISSKTVWKYWSEFKDYVAEINSDNMKEKVKKTTKPRSKKEIKVVEIQSSAVQENVPQIASNDVSRDVPSLTDEAILERRKSKLNVKFNQLITDKLNAGLFRKLIGDAATDEIPIGQRLDIIQGITNKDFELLWERLQEFKNEKKRQ